MVRREVEITMRKTGAKTKIRHSDTLFKLVLYLLSGIILLLVLYPIYFVIIASFSDPSAVAGGEVWLLPKGFTLDGYRELLRHSEIWIGYRNTIF